MQLAIVRVVKLLLYASVWRMNWMESVIQTAIIAIGWMLALLSLILWLERMIRIIMANYLIASILLGLWNFIDLISNRLLISPAERWVDGLQKWFWWALLASKPTVLLTVYFVLLLFIVSKAHIWLGRIKNDGLRIMLMLLFLPCTIISILLSIWLAIFGNQIMNLNELQLLATYVKDYPYAYDFIMLVPLRIILPGLVTIFVAAFVLRTKDEIVKKEFVFDFDKEEKSSTSDLISS